MLTSRGPISPPKRLEAISSAASADIREFGWLCRLPAVSSATSLTLEFEGAKPTGVELTHLTATEMLAGLERRDFTSRELVAAHFARMTAVDSRVHAIVHRFEAPALAAAEAADVRRKEGQARPLEGLPVTIKESLATAGLTVTLGVPNKRSLPPAEKDAVVVQLLKEQGVVPIAKTNVSQLLLFHESSNSLFGTTNNPWDLTRVPGGSSGGESAAIASGQSPAGVGGDIGGSIRVPCVFTGIAGFKPTTDRWSNLGSSTALMGQEIVRGQCGPMARTSRDVALLFESLRPQRMAELDPMVPPLEPKPIREFDLKSIRIGICEHPGIVEPSASVRRGIRLVAAHAQKLGFEVRTFDMPMVDEIFEVYFSALSSDGGSTLDAHLGTDPIAPQLGPLRKLVGLTPTVRKVVSSALSVKGDHRAARLIRLVHERSVAEAWKLAARRTDLRRRMLEALARQEVDVIVTPAHATVALRHGDSADFSVAGFGSMFVNLVGFPAGAIPVTTVQTSDAQRPTGDRLERRAASVERGSTGLPVGAQIVGRPYSDEMVLAVMIALEESLRSEAGFPKTPV